MVGERVVGRQLGAGGSRDDWCGVDEGALVKRCEVAYHQLQALVDDRE